MTGTHYIEANNLSLAWGRAARLVAHAGAGEVGSLAVAITGFSTQGDAVEDNGIRFELERLLRARHQQSVETVSNTIFPSSLWNPAAPRSDLFERYERIVPKLKKYRANMHGTYFDRMVSGGPAGKENQLDFAIRTYTQRKGVRRSVLQIGVFDPHKDHSASALRGFPCLQHVTFAPTHEGLLVNAFYATQYMIERAYGNYLGLCRLGQFVAHELDRPLTRVTTFIGLAERDGTVKGLQPVLGAVASFEKQAGRET